MRTCSRRPSTGSSARSQASRSAIPDVVDTVKSVFFPPKSEGKFAFVEFVDEVLTTTAIAMSGFEPHGL